MSLAIDMVGTKNNSGTYTFNLNFCRYLEKKKFNNKIYIFISNYYLKDLKIKNKNITLIGKSNYLNNSFLRLFWMQFILPFELKRLNIKHLYSPMNYCPLILKYSNIRVTLGLHSNLPWANFNKMPGNIINKFLIRLFMERSIKLSDKLIVCSIFAKKEIKQLLKLNNKKIFSINLGLDFNFVKCSKNKNYLKSFNYKNYALSILSCTRYHNIINILKAFKLLKSDIKINLRLVLVMQILDKKYYNEIKKFIDQNFKENEILIYNSIDKNYLINLYKKANFYVFTSYNEVFGFTTLEAMSQKCPVITSRKSALPEINGQASIYFDPDNILEIKSSMNKIINDKKLRKKLIIKGLKQSKKYSWDKTVYNTQKVLNIH